MDVVELLEAMIRFPSLSGEEKEVADFLQGFVSERGLEVGRHDDNIFFTLGEGKRLLLLNSHLDVVPASDGHPYDPFEPTRVDGRLYGRGAVDAKASGAAMTTALLELHSEGWTPDGRVMVALTSYEETGSGYNGMETMRGVLPTPDAALVGEPTEMQPCIAQKGLLILTAVARGRSAHAARAALGDNAIERAARDVTRLASFQFQRRDPNLGKPTVAVTTIDGGDARNVVPDECRFTLDIRSTPAWTHDELEAALRDRLDCRVVVTSKRLVPVETPADSRLLAAAQAASPDATRYGSPTCSDWCFLHHLDAIKVGPGTSRRSHTPDESVDLPEVVAARAFYSRVVERYLA